MLFTDLGLGAPLIRALEEEGYTAPTPIQAQAIPGVLAGHDLLGIAQTGTGKTAAFALPILARLAANKIETKRGHCRVLILSPTRELATQIAESFRTYGRHAGVSVAVVFGGVAHRPQIDTLRRGVDILVATPGRLIDHLDERNVSLEAVETFVLDEADQMLDLGFLRPIRNIVSRLSKKRQSLFFSATMPHEIGVLANELLTNPKKVSVAPAATTVERVNQRVILIEQSRKRSLLVELLADPAMTRTIIFTRTKRGADRVASHLEEAKISASAIHGNKSQPQREKALAAFRDARIRVLVATDIAARGIDIEQVSHVVNFELPEVPESYVHRIGRTARAGAEGHAIALVDAEERGLLRDIERLTRQQLAVEDRRGDTGLKADAKVASRPRGDRQQQGRGGRGGRPPQRGSDDRRGGGDRGGRSDERRDFSRGDRSDRGRDERREARPDDRRGPPRADEHRSAPRGEFRSDDRRGPAPRRDERRDGGDRAERSGRPERGRSFNNEPRSHDQARPASHAGDRNRDRGPSRGDSRSDGPNRSRPSGPGRDHRGSRPDSRGGSGERRDRNPAGR